MTADAQSAARREQTMLGVVFDAEAFGVARAAASAWQMWMERLDPAELRGVALYDGMMALAGGHQIVIIAISGPTAAVAYAHDAFAAPDLLAFTGIAPIAHRFIDSDSLPREQLTTRGYINTLGQFATTDQQSPLLDIARHAEWPIAPVIEPRPASRAPTPPPHIPEAIDSGHTLRMQAMNLEGATRVMLRLWRNPSIADVQARRRRQILIRSVGAAVGIIVAVLAGFWVVAQITDAHGRTSTSSPPSVFVVPQSVRVPCAPGELTQFTISNNSTTASVTWSSNGLTFDPPLSLSATSGVIPLSDAQVVQLTTTSYVVPAQTVTIIVTVAGSSIPVAVTYGGCPPLTSQP